MSVFAAVIAVEVNRSRGPWQCRLAASASCRERGLRTGCCVHVVAPCTLDLVQTIE